MSAELGSPFLGVPLKCTIFGLRNKGDYAYLKSVKRNILKKETNLLSCKCAKKLDWIFQGNKFMQLCGKNAELYWKTLAFRSSQVVNSVKVPIARSKNLVKVMSPVWEEGLLLFRCSVFFTVISGVCLLIWYGQSKAKVYIEASLLPSVCTLLSDHLQREFDFGKVRRVSPLSITLESCSVGPHSEEFSCGEIPTVKLRIRPFASLRKGKIVVDAVLSNPSLLVAQKKNYTWLGIPYTDGIPQRHLSAEEGIDYRTRTRRAAREEAAVRWERERDDAARISAEKGYIISECKSEDDPSKESAPLPTRLGTLDPFLYHHMDEKLRWRDHHCMDAGAEYDLKHADLERSFGAKVSGPETSFWSRIMPVSIRRKFKKKANGRDLSIAGIASKSRLLERSAFAARLFFEGQSLGKPGNSSNGSAGIDSQNLDVSPMKSRHDVSASVSTKTNSEGDVIDEHQDVKVDNNVHERKVKLTGQVSLEVENVLETDYVSRAILEIPSRNQMNGLLDPFLFALARLGKSINSNDKFSSSDSVVGTIGAHSCPRTDKYPEGGDTSKTDVRDDTVKNAQEAILDTQGAQSSGSSTMSELELSTSVDWSEQFLPLSRQLGLSSAFKSIGEAWTCTFVNPLQRLKSEIGERVEHITTEIVEEIDEDNTSGMTKMIPLVLDSVHVKGGTLMLLAYGDTEPRLYSCASIKSMFKFSFACISV